MKQRQWFFRIFFYILSMLILSLGITLNTKTGLGVSPIVSVSYSVSRIFSLNFGNVTFGLYVLFVAAELILRGKNRRYYDLLQIPVSLIFTRFLNIYDYILPEKFEDPPHVIAGLIAAVILTGIGAAMSVNMELVPNPGDGIVAALADFIGKDMGFTKNVFDLCCVCTALILDFITGHPFLGIGAGTIVTVLGVGRVVAVFNLLFKKKMAEMTGTDQ